MSYKIDILGTSVDNISKTDFLNSLNNRMEKGQYTSVYFANADCINKTFIDDSYRKVISKSNFLLADGSGLQIAARKNGAEFVENLNGTDLFPSLCKYAEDKKLNVYFLGAKEGVAKEMCQRIKLKYPKLKIIGHRHGYFENSREEEDFVNKLSDQNIDILFVAMGAPIQEEWISKFGRLTKASAVFGVGGLFDFYSGNIPRAPFWMRRLGIEWLFRLIKEPKRLWKRYVVGNPIFIYRLITNARPRS